jgi:hypothetical protein
LPGTGVALTTAAVLEELEVGLARLTAGCRARLLVFNGLTVQGGLGIFHSRECDNVVEFAIFLNLEELGLILLWEKVADGLLVVDVGNEKAVAGLLLAARSGGFARLL